MSSYCTLIMVGRVGVVPEERKTSTGKSMVTFRLAVGRWDGGDRKEVTDWFSVVAFDSTAETVVKHVAKGDLLLVDGRLQTRSYTGQDGKTNVRTEVIAARVKLFPRGRAADDRRVDERPQAASSFAAPSGWQADASVPF